MASPVQTATYNSSAAYVNSFTLATSGAVVGGNSLLVAIFTSSGSTGNVTGVTDNKGNTYTKLVGSMVNNRAADIWVANNASAGVTTITVAMANYVEAIAFLREYNGLVTTSPLDVSGSLGDSGYLNSHSVSLTTTNAADLLVGAYTGSNSSTAFTPGSGYGNLASSNNDSISAALIDRNVSATGAYSVTVTATQYEQGTMVAVALKLYARTAPPGASGQSNWYTYGYAPTGISRSTLLGMINTLWTQWKTNYLRTTGMPSGMPAGAYRVIRPDQNDPNGNPNGTVSEGIGYGMLLSVWVTAMGIENCRSYFDGMWAYYNYFKDSNGLMNYSIDYTGAVVGSGGATDADEDVAFALLLAHRMWGDTGTYNYSTILNSLLTAILTYEFYSATHSNTAIRNVMINGDQWDASASGSPDWVMPDYFAPAWYREFATYSGNSRWTDIVNANYPIMRANFDGYGTGLVPDQSTRAGAAVSGQSYENGYNAVRASWRGTLDYLWNGGTDNNYEAYYFSKYQADFISSQASSTVANLKAEYAIDGSSHGTYTNQTFNSAYMESMLVNSDHSAFAGAILTNMAGNYDGSYFGDSLTMLGLIMAYGAMTQNPSVPATNQNFFAYM